MATLKSRKPQISDNQYRPIGCDCHALLVAAVVFIFVQESSATNHYEVVVRKQWYSLLTIKSPLQDKHGRYGVGDLSSTRNFRE